MKQVAGPVSLFIALVAAAAVPVLGSAAAQDGAARKPLTLIVGALRQHQVRSRIPTTVGNVAIVAVRKDGIGLGRVGLKRNCR